MKYVFRTALISFIFICLISFGLTSKFTAAEIIPATESEETENTDTGSGLTLSLDGFETGSTESLKIIFLITIISLAPSILIMMTSFTRIVIVLSCVRNAIGLQQTPPNQVLVGLAMFLTLFIMSPVLSEIKTEAYDPYEAGTINGEEAIEKALDPIRGFMIKQTKAEDLNLFISLSGDDVPEDYEDIKTETLIPAFITSELKKAFIIGFLMYLPFLIIDMVVASTLMSMGMVMLPPVMISLPFKIMLFVVINGWELVVKTLIVGFNP